MKHTIVKLTINGAQTAVWCSVCGLTMTETTIALACPPWSSPEPKTPEPGGMDRQAVVEELILLRTVLIVNNPRFDVALEMLQKLISKLSEPAVSEGEEPLGSWCLCSCHKDADRVSRGPCYACQQGTCTVY